MNARVHQPVHSDQHARSYYAASTNHQLDYPALRGEVRVDVCIVGGGFSGLNTAIELAQKGFSVALLEAHKIGWGASGRNGGQLIRGVGHDVHGATVLRLDARDHLQRGGRDRRARP